MALLAPTPNIQFTHLPLQSNHSGIFLFSFLPTRLKEDKTVNKINNRGYQQIRPMGMQNTPQHDLRMRSNPAGPPIVQAAIGSPPPQQQQAKFESALDYLDQVLYPFLLLFFFFFLVFSLFGLIFWKQVKIKFADQPDVYSQFLEIMKEFKSRRFFDLSLSSALKNNL